MSEQLRVALVAAIDKRTECQNVVERAQATLRRGKQSVTRARAAVAQIASEARSAALAKAKAIKAGDAESRSAASGAVSAALQARADLDTAEEAVSILAEECSQAEAALENADEKVKRLAADLITSEADAIADELIAANEKAFRLRCSLMGLGYVGRGFGPGAHVAWPLTAKVQVAIHWREPDQTAANNPTGTATQAWLAYRNRLTADANSTFDGKSEAQPAPKLKLAG